MKSGSSSAHIDYSINVESYDIHDESPGFGLLNNSFFVLRIFAKTKFQIYEMLIMVIVYMDFISLQFR